MRKTELDIGTEFKTPMARLRDGRVPWRIDWSRAFIYAIALVFSVAVWLAVILAVSVWIGAL